MKLGLLGLLLAGVASAQQSLPVNGITLGFNTTVPASCAPTDAQALLVLPLPNTAYATPLPPALYLCRSGVYLQLIVATRFADGEVPAGTQDGKNKVFTLAHIPVSASPLITQNGLVLRKGNDYTLSGLTLTFTAPAPAPGANDLLQAWYRW